VSAVSAVGEWREWCALLRAVACWKVVSGGWSGEVQKGEKCEGPRSCSDSLVLTHWWR
jgi:hypothetical protein